MAQFKERFALRILEKSADLPEKMADGLLDALAGFFEKIVDDIIEDKPKPPTESKEP